MADELFCCSSIIEFPAILLGNEASSSSSVTTLPRASFCSRHLEEFLDFAHGRWANDRVSAGGFIIQVFIHSTVGHSARWFGIVGGGVREGRFVDIKRRGGIGHKWLEQAIKMQRT